MGAWQGMEEGVVKTIAQDFTGCKDPSLTNRQQEGSTTYIVALRRLCIHSENH